MMRATGNSVVLIFPLIVYANAVEIKSISRRDAEFDKEPYYTSSLTEFHQFSFRQPLAGGNGKEFEELKLLPSDFFYLFTGDTQHWTPCTMENTACHRVISNCSRNRNSNKECNKKQAEFSNKLQQISMAALNRRLIAVTGRREPILGLIINGDLTEFGHDDELNRFKTLWTTRRFDSTIKVYPGLGNHDYANNVGQCTLDHCVNRMLRWYRSYVKDTLLLPLDLRTSNKYFVTEENSGSLAYSWNECADSHETCFHFIQLNNYPTYAKHIDMWLISWKILPSLNWLSNDIRREGVNKSIVINFHDFDSSFSPSDKFRLRSALNSAIENSPGARVVAIFFAHMHHLVGLKEWWCVGGRRVPLIYSGSVPGNNYVLARFSLINGNMKAYSIRVDAENASTIDIEATPEVQETCVE